LPAARELSGHFFPCRRRRRRRRQRCCRSFRTPAAVAATRAHHARRAAPRTCAQTSSASRAGRPPRSLRGRSNLFLLRICAHNFRTPRFDPPSARGKGGKVLCWQLAAARRVLRARAARVSQRWQPGGAAGRFCRERFAVRCVVPRDGARRSVATCPFAPVSFRGPGRGTRTGIARQLARLADLPVQDLGAGFGRRIWAQDLGADAEINTAHVATTPAAAPSRRARRKQRSAPKPSFRVLASGANSSRRCAFSNFEKPRHARQPPLHSASRLFPAHRPPPARRPPARPPHCLPAPAPRSAPAPASPQARPASCIAEPLPPTSPASTRRCRDGRSSRPSRSHWPPRSPCTPSRTTCRAISR
jgi:hypothetical protein